MLSEAPGWLEGSSEHVLGCLSEPQPRLPGVSSSCKRGPSLGRVGAGILADLMLDLWLLHVRLR